jgi:5-(carboxyamino)imidazole ribonucleotide mutase
LSKVAIITGSDSDLPIVSETCKTFDEFGINYHVRIISAHRTPEVAASFARTARHEGFQVIIAAAGMAAHLPGVLAAYTTLPVIGLPIASGPLAGQDALFSIVQMPPGIPVASVGINAARNAALLAVEILSSSDSALADALERYREKMKASVTTKDAALQAKGVTKYLDEAR